MVLEKPKLLFETQVSRRKYVRRVFWNLLAAVAAFGAWVALDSARTRIADRVDPLLLQAGGIVALGVAALFIVRLVFNLFRAVRRRNETARFFDRGFMWQIGKGAENEHKYAWSQVKNFREGVRTLRLGRLVLAQMGAHVFTMRDGRVYKFTPVHGDMRAFVRTVRPYIADALGERMGRALREGKTVKIHPQLTIAPKGIQAGNQKIRWSELDVEVKRGKLRVRKLAEKGKFKVVKTYPVRQVDNLGGFIEVANVTIRNHQPERFNIRTQRYGV